MDFSFSEEQVMVRDLARGILEKEVTPERIKAVEEGGEWFDRPLWATLAEAGLLGLAFDEEHGGMGFGFEELCVLLEEIGRVVAPIPAIAALALGGANIAEFGSEEQKQKLLPAIAAGDLIVTAAFGEDGGAFVREPSSSARREGGSWIIDGVKELAPAADLATYILVPAMSEEGVMVFIVASDAEGLSVESNESTTCEPLSTLRLNSVRVAAADVLGAAANGSVNSGEEQLVRMEWRALVAVCACQVGVAEKALSITADYVREREQFGVPIGSFQAVQHRCADAYINLQTTRWVTWRAAWKLAQGMEAGRECSVAKFWAAETGYRIANTSQHLHGGMGVDLDYPLYRYFLQAKALELSFGGATPHLNRLGRMIADAGSGESL